LNATSTRRLYAESAGRLNTASARRQNAATTWGLNTAPARRQTAAAGRQDPAPNRWSAAWTRTAYTGWNPHARKDSAGRHNGRGARGRRALDAPNRTRRHDAWRQTARRSGAARRLAAAGALSRTRSCPHQDRTGGQTQAAHAHHSPTHLA
jgi:hypothetical protein